MIESARERRLLGLQTNPVPGIAKSEKAPVEAVGMRELRPRSHPDPRLTVVLLRIRVSHLIEDSKSEALVGARVSLRCEISENGGKPASSSTSHAG